MFFSRSIFLILITISIVSRLSAQAPGLEWDKSYDIGYYTSFKDIKQTDDNGFIICGHCSEEGTTLYDDILLVKIDAEGNTEWEKRLGEPESSEYAYSVLITDDGGYLMTGKNWKNKSVLLVKVNSSGESEWQKEYFTDASDCEGTRVIKDQDNNYYIAGYAEGISGSKGKADAIQIKTNSSGVAAWTKNYGGTENDYGKHILLKDDGGSVLLGFTWSFGVETYTSYFVNTDANGNEVSKKIKDEYVSGGIPTIDRGFVMFGRTYKEANSIDASKLYAYDAEFSELWSRRFADIAIRMVTECPNGEIILVADGLIIKLDADNYEEWRQEAGDENVTGIVARDGSFVMVGNEGSETALLIRTNPFLSSSGTNPPVQTGGLKVCPNPAIQSATIYFDNPEGRNYTLSIRDLSGKVCRVIRNICNSEYTITKDDLTPGVYLIELTGNKVFRGKLIYN